MAEIFDIQIKPINIIGKTQKGSTVFGAAESLDVPLRSDCGKNGTCGKCRIIVDKPFHLNPETKNELKVLTESQLESSQRLACQAKICGPVTITIPEDLIIKKEVFGKTRVTGSFKVNSPEIKATRISLGVAFDIGTTTLAAYLCDFNSGRIITSKALVNPQRQFGEDVISRIAAVGEDESNLVKQQMLVIKAMNDLVDNCLKATGNVAADIIGLTIVGNTTMQHILGGLDPTSLGVSPYLPDSQSSTLTNAHNLGLKLLPGIPIYIFPVISGFLGGDILAALLADSSYKRNETTMIIDIGTNGELMLSNGQGLWATSCATGPALEGAQISCGMRASSGAISRVLYDSDSDSKIRFETIGNTKSIGICGSGIIDALAVMRKIGITMENGTFNNVKSGVIRDATGMGRKYIIPGSEIDITLKDVRQVQLAKAALFVGIESLLKKAGITKVDKTILTGAFGAKFNWQNARDIGMLPPEICNGKVECMQNLAGTGAVMALLDQDRRTEIETIAETVTFIDLSTEPDFTLKFSKATQFPVIK